MADWMLAIFPQSRHELDRIREGTSTGILIPGSQLQPPLAPQNTLTQVMVEVQWIWWFVCGIEMRKYLSSKVKISLTPTLRSNKLAAVRQYARGNLPSRTPTCAQARAASQTRKTRRAHLATTPIITHHLIPTYLIPTILLSNTETLSWLLQL